MDVGPLTLLLVGEVDGARYNLGQMVEVRLLHSSRTNFIGNPILRVKEYSQKILDLLRWTTLHTKILLNFINIGGMLLGVTTSWV